MIPIKSNLILTVPPEQGQAALAFGVPLGHMAYRVGGGPHLFRARMSVTAHGGLMVIDSSGFDGRGEVTPFCHEVMHECAARNFSGIICDFEGHARPALGKIVTELGELIHKRGCPLYVPECYAPHSAWTKVLISSALSGGSLVERLREATQKWGAERIALAVERVAEDFFLPSPTGQGVPLTCAELEQRIETRTPTIFFSSELCAHYFTYMSKQSGAHFVLFDDAGSIRKKLEIAQSLAITHAVLAYPQVADLLPALFA